ncbi:MAG: DUF1538 domain-containing protein [Actinobacteria bacterium]|nr:DUF1538 domain-containing protein [Actinomycetota bacterium]
MSRRLREAFFEVAGPVLPVALLVVFLQLVVVRVPSHLFARFGIGVALVIVGLFLFLVGVRLGLIPVGEYVGAHLPERVPPWLLVVVVLILGFVATVAEPDVRVLSGVVDSVTGGWLTSSILVLIIGAGLGFALAVAVLRQIIGTRIGLIFGVGYVVVLALFPFVSPEFIAISLDSGATTTGPLTVPLIMAIGLGVARTIGRRSSLEDGFGLIGIASLGPVILLAIIGLFA